MLVCDGDLVELAFSAHVPEGSDRPFYVWEGVVKRAGTDLGYFCETNELP